jgi:dUTP pyrophosphatase
MPEVKFKKLHENAKLPRKANPTDACYDVWAVSVEITPEFVRYKLGFSTEIPEGWQAKIYMRSSVSKKDVTLCNAVATIDAPYRGEWELRFNMLLPNEVISHASDEEADKALAHKYRGWSPKIYDLSEAIGQMEIIPVWDIDWVESDDLTQTQRGEGGFGSSNKTINPETREGDGS